jgi:glycolate oxidase FAD binding subunit
MSDSPGTTALCAVDGIEPRWVVRPGSAEEVSRILALAWAEGLAVAPRGSGARTALGNPPNRLDLALDLTRLSAIVDYVPEDMVATVQCGITLGALAQRLAEHSQRLALDPLDGDGRTVGGVLAAGSSGPLRFRYGTGRDLLLGVRFVQADGTVTWGGAKVVKSVSGYDVPKLLVGSLGTLGVIVEATLRLHPLPAVTEAVLASAKSPAGLQDLLAALLDSSLEPDRIFLLNTEALRDFSLMLGALPAGPALLVTFGSVEEAVRSQGEAVAGLARSQGGAARRVPMTSPTDLGKYLGGAGQVSFTLGCEIRRVGHWLGELERLAAAVGAPVSVVGEAGNGVLRASLDAGADGGALVRELILPLRSGLEGEGGSLVVEAMPVPLKVGFDVWGSVAPGALAVMRRIKQEFDPRGVLNPGRFVGGL